MNAVGNGEDALLRADDGPVTAANMPVTVEVWAFFRVASKSDWRDVLNALGGLGAEIDEIRGLPEDWRPDA